jgi:hypothetical protein
LALILILLEIFLAILIVIFTMIPVVIVTMIVTIVGCADDHPSGEANGSRSSH